MRTTEHPPAPQQHAAEACCQKDGCCRGLLLGCVHSVKAFKASACLPVLATLAAIQKLAVAPILCPEHLPGRMCHAALAGQAAT